MAPIFTREKINKFFAAGNDIAIPILTLVKEASGAFPPLQYAAIGALLIVTNVKVSSAYPNRQLKSIVISADCSYKGFRDSKKEWEEFSHYVTEMVGETALRWEVLSHSGSEESLERWKKNIEELHGCVSLFHSLR